MKLIRLIAGTLEHLKVLKTQKSLTKNSQNKFMSNISFKFPYVFNSRFFDYVLFSESKLCCSIIIVIINNSIHNLSILSFMYGQIVE